MSATLRAATHEDASEIVRVLRTSRIRYLPYALPAHSEEEDLHWVSSSLIPSGRVTIASVGGSIVGVLAASDVEGVSWINQMYVDPEHCNQGIGSQLLASALDALPAPVRLYTFQKNARARRFYERFGFRPVAFGDGSANEEGCPDVLYELSADLEADSNRRGN
jgi:GNAT superfamily N-acetyltransferase